MPSGCCSNCLAFGSACTYVQPYGKRGPKYSANGTIGELKGEIAYLKAKLRSLSICSLCSQPLQSQTQGNDSPAHISASPGVKSEEPPEEQDLSTNELADRFSQFSLATMKTTYLGAGSNFALFNKASMMKEKYLGPSSSTHSRRPYFWQPLPWEIEVLSMQPHYVYPPEDLLASLLGIYFTNVHPTIPILHRPSFERSVAEGLHFRDREFGGTLLALLAIASRYSTDPRVFVDGGAPHSAGWKFASQLWNVHKFFEPTLYEIQMYALLSVFVLGTSAPYASWLYVGIGIRCLQQRGQHRRKPASHQWSPEDELWKRAFWLLFALERIGSLFLGRPMGLHVEEYDVELPLEVDDEYWDKGFAQPAGKPSQLSYLVCYVQLCEASTRLKIITISFNYGADIGRYSTTTICAARAILHTADIWVAKLQRVPLPNITNSVFMAGVILVLYTLGTKRAGLPMDKNKDLVHIETALKILKFAEARLQPPGRSWELLMELRSLDGPLLSKAPPYDAGASRGMATSSPSDGQYSSQSIDSWNNMFASDQPPESIQGKSIEELLASPGHPFTAESILDDDLMSMWMAATTASDIDLVTCIFFLETPSFRLARTTHGVGQPTFQSNLSRAQLAKSSAEGPVEAAETAKILRYLSSPERWFFPCCPCELQLTSIARCDGPQMPSGCCSNCLAFGSACTYVQPSNRRGRKYAANGTIEELKREIAYLKAKLRSLSVCSLCSQPLQSQAQGNDSPANISTSPGVESEEPPEEQDLSTNELADRFSQFSLAPITTIYLGAGSQYALVNKASMVKEKYLGPSSATHSRRPYFWQSLPWEIEVFSLQPHYVYPPEDLLDSLLRIYFTNVHPTIPILHRPSFERSVAEGLHFRDRGFGGTLLALLAIASRYSTDPRVFVDGGAPHSAGCKFASQLWNVHKFFAPTLYETQMYALLSVYVLGTSAPYASWLYIGIGIRCLQQCGQHRRKPASHQWSPEDELWKRAFWLLFTLERIGSLFFGRPMGLHVEEYDIELPLEVDDEYWDQGFTQPAGRPSQLSYLILGDTLRRLYGSKKAKILMGWDGEEWEQRAVAELHSTMNRFSDLIPSHLRWDPENLQQGAFFDQSAQLHISYNYVLIAIHRRYIQRPSAPSLSICASAARAILHTADIWVAKLQRVPFPNITNSVFMAGVILVLYTLGTKRAGLPMDKNKDLVHIETALKILKFAEARLQPPGRSWELLMELRSLDGPLLSKAPPYDAGASQGMATPSISDEQFFSQSIDSWNSTLASDQPPESIQGKSIEELLASPGRPFTVESILDDDLMALWMAVATASDIETTQHWDAFMENRTDLAVNRNWSFAESYP
ncbi:Fungal-trans domain-containing protein [Mycena sanguinolenta]|uniref:Fungal-trans domain-containing protein n=1 Tax=Mycena sanguinolenta TaxID=230812 RepID=A0A8H6ZKX8_9AGAR|nr:Fungal-trans domain-containing protein [Mycena sanguinolenta]